MVEQQTLNLWVQGSSPWWCTNTARVSRKGNPGYYWSGSSFTEEPFSFSARSPTPCPVSVLSASAILCFPTIYPPITSRKITSEQPLRSPDWVPQTHRSTQSPSWKRETQSLANWEIAFPKMFDQAGFRHALSRPPKVLE